MIWPASNGEALIEFNGCHSPESGKFCSTEGGGSGAGKPSSLKWKTSTVQVPAGEYGTTAATQHTSADGRFSIVRVGHVNYRRDAGVRGHLSQKFRWTGYSLTDHASGLPSYLPSSVRATSVSHAKRLAANRLRKYPGSV